MCAAPNEIVRRTSDFRFNEPFISIHVIEDVILAEGDPMLKFLLWCILLVLCWPLAILALILYPIVWLLLLPFRLLGFAVGGVFELIKALFYLPSRIMGGPGPR
jgi:hypothetical protein